jgi:aspartyl-tRNA(Asn)/glutamyl-tRNA(Gln) amidotransferase subunit A
LRLPAGWCGIYSLKPSLGRIPIDPAYTGRAAGPMTRTVADSALLMQVLSQSDDRDSMSPPPHTIAWDDWDAPVRFVSDLRIGLPMAPFLTRQMLDGMDHAWRMRSHLDLAALPSGKRDTVLPYIRQWADSVKDMPAFAAELPSPTNDPLRPLEHIAFTVPYNMSEQPAASIQCGYTADGLPIGLQIAGRRFDDWGVLQVSRAFELLRDPLQAWPQVPVA